MGEINGVFREETFQHEGITYKMHRPSFETEKNFETWLEKKALLKINNRRGDLGEINFRMALSVWERDCAAGEYAWLSETGQKAVGNPEGLQTWLWMVLTQSNPDMLPKITEAKVKEILDAQNEAILSKMANGEMEEPEIIAAYKRVTSKTPTMPPITSGAKS